MNLVVNARDAMPGGGRLEIAVDRAPEDAVRDVASPPVPAGDGHSGFARLAVRDTGVGIDAEARAHLFEPFFTTKQEGQGTGLGLATVYGIVEGAGGSIRVESSPGAGARFEILWPRVEVPTRVGAD
jgi:two-component system, cell cycle sensor histidine kinase and response regulator CckA